MKPAKNHDEAVIEALTKLKNSTPPNRGAASRYARKHFDEIKALRSTGFTYADITTAIKKSGGPDITPDQLGNALLKLSAKQQAVATPKKPRTPRR
jgi:hypothetical protein